MLCVGEQVKQVDFCIYTFVDFQVIPVKRDEAFISEMVTKLEAFYNNFFKEALLKERLYKRYHKFF